MRLYVCAVTSVVAPYVRLRKTFGRKYSSKGDSSECSGSRANAAQRKASSHWSFAGFSCRLAHDTLRDSSTIGKAPEGESGAQALLDNQFSPVISLSL